MCVCGGETTCMCVCGRKYLSVCLGEKILTQTSMFSQIQELIIVCVCMCDKILMCVCVGENTLFMIGLCVLILVYAYCVLCVSWRATVSVRKDNVYCMSKQRHGRTSCACKLCACEKGRVQQVERAWGTVIRKHR